VFASGVVLLLAGPGSRGLWKPIDDYSFGVWLAIWCGHIVLHLPDLPKLWSRHQSDRPWDDHGSGGGGRALALAGALVFGAVLAILSLPLFAAWSHLLT
jgi:hypothetical protein